jgi:hypothetical protein
MAWEDKTVNELKQLAVDNGLDVDGLKKAEIIDELEKNAIDEPGVYEVSGVQPTANVPLIPITRSDFRRLVENPELPPENQSAPPQDLLNPHLFPQR